MTEHDMPLITTMAFGLTMAFICGLIATRLRLSPIIGYLVAGIMMGPHTPGYVANQAIATQLSEIGIVLLMFGVGLHFSIKDLLAVKKIAIIGAVSQMVISILLGIMLAANMGWSNLTGLLLGLCCSVASTVVMTRTFEDNHILHTTTGQIAIGWLIVQDIVMVLALVIFPALINGQDIRTGDMDVMAIWSAIGIAITKVILFILVMTVAGKKCLPWLLSIGAASKSRELFTLSVFAVAVGVAYLTGQIFGVSLALGAFFSGMMIRETSFTREVADRAMPFQDAFAVLFFVSVGMLFNPMVIFEQPSAVLCCVLIIVFFKSMAALLVTTCFRYPMKTGLFVSAGLGQIGEFSFILASLGVSLGILPPVAQSLILAAALISIVLNPFFFWTSIMIEKHLEKHLPTLHKFLPAAPDELSHLTKQQMHRLKKTVILVGAGRVGTYLYEHIPSHEIDLIIIDSNRERVEHLRTRGLNAIYGDAGDGETLKKAAIDKALAMIIVIPDAFRTNQIVATVKKIKPGIRIVVQDRYHPYAEELMDGKIDLNVSATDEIGRRMLEYLYKI